MQINQLSNLVLIRNYVQSMSVSMSIPRPQMKQMSDILIVLDNLLLKELCSPKFKEVIAFDPDEAKEAVKEFVKRNNIKSSLPKNEKLDSMHEAIKFKPKEEDES